MQVEQVFGIVLKDIRAGKKVSQSELANLADLDRTYISLLERGLRQPTVSTIFKIAEALNIKPSLIIQQMEGMYES